MVHPYDCAGTDGTMLFHGVDNSVDGGDKHLTHLTQVVGSHLKPRNGGDKHLTYLTQVAGCHLNARSEQNVCVDDGKEDGVDNSVDSGDKHLTYLTQFENNDDLDGCNKHFTHVVKKNSESLMTDVTGHVTYLNFFGKMPFSKNVIIRLRVGGLKDDRNSINDGQKGNDDKNNGDTNN
eukprot:4608301-Ditylum_brightwellii.AAC.1